MTIRHLKIFIAVAECGSMSGAASKLFLSQPTISQAIRELEEYYDTQLFDRIAKRLYITPMGQTLLAQAYQVVGQFDQMEAQMKKSSQKNSLRIGGTITVGAALLSNIMADFEKQMPEAETFACIENTKMIEEKLLRSELDIAIVEGEIHHKDLVSVPCIRDFLVLCCGPGHPFANRETIHVQELNGANFIMREPGSGTRALFNKFIKTHNLQIHTSWEATCPEAFRSAMLYNGCLAVISVRLLERDIMEKRIRIFQAQSDEFERSFSVVYHKGKVHTPAMNLIQKIIADYQQPHWLSEIPIGTLLE